METVQATEEKSESHNKAAREYLDHLLNDGINEEGVEGEVELPPWYNEELFKRAQFYYQKYLFALFASMSAGLIAVLGIPSILQVLVGTKQSSTDALAYRRYIRTIFHVKCWYESLLKSDSDSWRSIETVRNAHFKASKICEKSNYGRITQKDLALTQFGFIGFIALRGKIPEKEFYEANTHFWRVIGYMIGIKDEYNLCTESWETTKPRLQIVSNDVFKPALQNTSDKFKELTTHLVNGLWCLNSLMTLDSSIFITKWLAGCEGYEYLKTDFKDQNNVPKDGLSDAYKNLNFWDRFIVNYSLIIALYLYYQYNLVRWYMNFRVKLSLILIYYFPFLAFIKFGIKWGYVRIFDRKLKKKSN